MNQMHDLESIFAEAVELADPRRRAVFLDDACAGNSQLLNRVNDLLSASAKAESFMSEPAGIVKLPGELEADPVGEQPGDHVGRYRLLQQIGEGGMGSVFMAEQEDPVRRRVALKIVKPGLDTKEVIARFESERQALAMMNHPNIARALDAGATPQGRPFFVMELVKGISVTDFCNNEKLTARQRLELFVPICQAIQHAHQKGIIHRDIKPRNVMITLVDGKPIPKVIDFGIAKATDHRLTERTLFTKYGEFIGTPAYMSPEQAELSGIDVDTRSDVYSLGALLYELLAGKPSFDRDQVKPLGHDELRKLIREETPPCPSAAISTLGDIRATTVARARSSTPRELQSQLHGELDWIVMRALEKERARRYETVSAMADDIERYLRHEEVTARPPTRAYRLRKLIARNRIAVTAVTLVLVTLIGATGISALLALRAIRANERASVETETLQEVVDFINNGLFAQANPHEEPNRNVTLRAVVDRAAKKLDAQSIHRPSVEAAIRTTIGETYRGLGEYELSLKHLRRAHQLYIELAMPADRRSIDAASNLVQALLLLAKYEEAEPILSEILRQARAQLAADDPILIRAIQLDASRLESLGLHDQASALLSDLIDRTISSFGSNHPESHKATANLAYVRQSQGRFEEALDLLQEAHDGMLQTEGEWHPSTLKVTSHLASLHAARGEKDKAAALYRATLPHAERLLGADHPQTLTVKHGWALSLFAQRDVAVAEAALEEVLTQQREQLGAAHPSTLVTMHNLARVHQTMGRYLDAEALLKEELMLRRQVHRAHDPATLRSLTNLAFFYLDRGLFGKAIPHYEQAAALLDDETMDSIIAWTLLGLCRHKTGDHVQARANLESAKRASEAYLPGHWLEFVIDSLLGEVYQTLGDRTKAEDALLRGHTGLQSVGNEVPPRWKPLGLRAATRRLMQFYDAAEAEEMRARAESYREELAHLLQPQATQEIVTETGPGGDSEDGNAE